MNGHCGECFSDVGASCPEHCIDSLGCFIRARRSISKEFLADIDDGLCLNEVELCLGEAELVLRFLFLFGVELVLVPFELNLHHLVEDFLGWLVLLFGIHHSGKRK